MGLASVRSIRSFEDAQKAFLEIAAILRQGIEFGHPQDPRDPTGTDLAGDGSVNQHNGTLVNVRGSWAQAEFTAADTATTFNHNLDLEVDSGGGPNVVWLVGRFEHNGTLANASSTLSVSFETGDSVGRDSIELRLYAGGARTVDGSNPVLATLFFLPAVR